MFIPPSPFYQPRLMSKYHSRQPEWVRNFSDLPQLCGVPLLPLSHGSVAEGPCTVMNSTDQYKDIIDESLEFFRITSALENYQSAQSSSNSADKLVVYLTWWIRECLGVISDKVGFRRPSSAGEAGPTNVTEDELVKLMNATSATCDSDRIKFFNTVFAPPGNNKEKAVLEQYLSQLRLETIRRLVRIVHNPTTGECSKWWLQYAST